ncbi:MAG TPA: serine protease [Myxococcaceae bacterium]|nr:serine protease [Myxococcaceae bacterium]
MARLPLLEVLALSSLACATARVEPKAAKEILQVPAPTARSVAQQILPHNVRVILYDGDEPRRTASGVVVGSEVSASGSASYVLTNAHAVTTEGMQKPRMTIMVDHGPDAVEYAAEGVALGQVPDMDLALIRVRGASLQPAVLAEDSELEPGEDVVVAAAPYGKSVSLSGGMVSQVEWDRSSRKPKMLKTDAAIGYGASGGGVFSRTSGRLLAIVEGYRTAKVGFAVAEQAYSFDVPMPGETFAAPSSKVRDFLKSHGFGRFLEPRAAPINARASAR